MSLQVNSYELVYLYIRDYIGSAEKLFIATKWLNVN